MKTDYRMLDSGLKVYHVEHPAGLTQMQLFTPFGGNILKYRDAKTNEIIDIEPGSAHYFEHVLFIMPPLAKNGQPIKYRTNTPKTQKNLRDGMSLLQANNVISVNAYTWHDITNYHFASRIKTLENLDILTEFVFTPYLPQDRFKKEVGTILDEARRELNNAGMEQFHQWCKQMFVNHGAREPIIGTLESIPQISLSDVLSMHDTFYCPSNMTLLVTGDADLDEICKVVDIKLRDLGKDQYVAPPGEVDQNEPDKVLNVDNFDSPIVRNDIVRPNVLCGWKYLPNPQSMSREELIDLHTVAQLATHVIFGEGTVNREALVKKVDERTFWGQTYPFRDHGWILFGVDTESPEQFKELIGNSAYDLVYSGVDIEELEYARNYLLTDEDIKQDRLGLLGDQLTRWGVLTRDPLDYFTAIKRMETITKGEVDVLLSKVFKPESMTCSLMIPKGK